MGRIKTTLVKRTSRKLVESLPESFAKDFESNKKSLGNTTMPSKRMRNMVAGYITRLKRNSQKIIDDKQ
jgi:ribosomal protein S17E